MKYIITKTGQTVGTGEGNIPLGGGLVWSATAGTVIVTAPEPVIDPMLPIIKLREGYRQACRAFCALAGVSQKDKLEDTEYVTVRQSAYTADPITAGILTDTMTYCLQTLRLDDGRDAWDRI